jgi:hypothetical protein
MQVRKSLKIGSQYKENDPAFGSPAVMALVFQTKDFRPVALCRRLSAGLPFRAGRDSGCSGKTHPDKMIRGLTRTLWQLNQEGANYVPSEFCGGCGCFARMFHAQNATFEPRSQQ